MAWKYIGTAIRMFPPSALVDVVVSFAQEFRPTLQHNQIKNLGRKAYHLQISRLGSGRAEKLGEGSEQCGGLAYHGGALSGEGHDTRTAAWLVIKLVIDQINVGTCCRLGPSNLVIVIPGAMCVLMMQDVRARRKRKALAFELEYSPNRHENTKRRRTDSGNPLGWVTGTKAGGKVKETAHDDNNGREKNERTWSRGGEGGRRLKWEGRASERYIITIILSATARVHRNYKDYENVGGPVLPLLA
ncbi:hypothetical protein EDB87DRAFT_1823610 [Lactarius vividus]|nr:hypothetical protein EDB87DRAFT_1823610 [Lactarius vividus]